MKLSEIIVLINNKDIAIYGKGFVAETFYAILKMRGIEKKVKYFIVTDEEKANGTIHGIPIKSIKDIVNEKEILICIAVHEVIKDDIEKILIGMNINNFVWIHPYIVELALGEMIEHHKKIEISKLIQQEPYDNYALAVRFIAIENYYNKNDIGYDIYVKVFSQHCEVETARNRLKRFISLIADWDKNGYRDENDILIDENYRRVEGIHRLALACYHRMKYIYCNIYPYSDNYDVIMKGGSDLSMRLLQNANLNLLELNAIERANMKLRESYE